MKTTVFVLSLSLVCLEFVAEHATAQIILFGPTQYVQTADRPDGFCQDCQLEDFEDNLIDPILSFDCGEILGPNIADPRIPGVEITDSVDGDDGILDGNGNSGHSYFCVDPNKSITVSFAEPVIAAGAVFTDGDRRVEVTLEAFDTAGELLGTLEAGRIADASYFGETDEDHFLGIRSDAGIGSFRMNTIGPGGGIEIDHITWEVASDEPSLSLDLLNPVCAAVAARSADLQFDLNGDGTLSIEDTRFLLGEFQILPGDADLDGEIGFADFAIFAGNFGNPGNYTDGDFTCDGVVQFPDFPILASNFGESAETTLAAVPEPVIWWSTSLGLLAAWRRIRRR